MVLHTMPPGHLSKKLTTPEPLKTVVKEEPMASPVSFSGGTPHWPPRGSPMMTLPATGIGRLHPHSSVSGQSSPKVEQHQFHRVKERELACDMDSHDRKRPKTENSVHASPSQTQLLSPRGIVGASGHALVTHSSLPARKYSESHPAGDRNPSPPGRRLSHSVSFTGPLKSEESLLGLTLRKTPSLLSLIEMKLAQGAGSGDQNFANSEAASAKHAGTVAVTAAASTTAAPSTPQDKLKASNFPASSLKIGTWERTSRHEGDLVGKCYYAKRKLVWEVLENGLKSKIEIQWSDISAIKASFPENLPGTLDIEVSKAPLFHRETNPQPRKHTLWQATSDFTNHQASICKRHSLQFPAGVLNKHYEKLMQCDPRLKELAEGPHSARPMPDFDHSGWLFDGAYNHQNGSGRDGKKIDTLFVIHPHLHTPLPRTGSVTSSDIRAGPNPEVRLVKMHRSDSTSPSSVFEARAGDESGTEDTEEIERRLHDDVDFSSDYDGLKLDYTNNRGHMPVLDMTDIKGTGGNGHGLMTLGDRPVTVPHPQQMGLEEIEQVLLGDSAAPSNEQQVMMYPPVHFGQMSAAMGEGTPPTEQQVSPLAHGGGLERSSVHDAHHLSSYIPYHRQFKSEVDSRELQQHPHQVDQQPQMLMGSGSGGSDGGRGVAEGLGHRDLSSNSLLSCFRYGSAGDLIDFPRVASLPQLFESPHPVSLANSYTPIYVRPSFLHQ